MSADEIVRQIELTRNTLGATGHIHFNARVLMDNVDGISDRLAMLYREPALVPASPWLDRIGPDRPIASAVRDAESGGILVRFAPQARQAVSRWLIQARVDGVWHTQILPGVDRRHILMDQLAAADLVSVSAVDRNGNVSVPALDRSR